jgi:hypothetical protein
MIKKLFDLRYNFLAVVIITLFSLGTFSQSVAQSNSSSSQDNQLKPLRSDVGIHGLTANAHFLSDFSYLGTDTLNADGSSELEIVYRNVRTMSPRLGVGFQIVTSFFTDGENADFGVGSWGAGPVVRAYPFKTDRFQPYVQLNSLFGNNLAVSTLANTEDGGDGFRIRLGLRGGFALRLSNSVGLFTELGYDWESSRLFRSDARALQANVGVDLYLFN